MASRRNPDSFLEELTPMSEALVSVTIGNQQAAGNITTFFVTIGNEKCFKPFASKFFDGLGNVRISSALDEIRGMATFRNVHSLASDISDELSATEKRNRFFFGSGDYMTIVWDYCILSKMEAESSGDEIDESDEMQFEIFQKLADFYRQHRTFAAYSENEIMDLFRYFCARDVILEAGKFLSNAGNEDETQIEEDNEMETESILHDDTSIDTLSKIEKFYLKNDFANGKEVYALFEHFKTDGVDITKLDHLLMLKSKSFYQVEKKKGLSVNLAGLIFSEEESIGINRTENIIKMKMPSNC
jgi:hypothetical protein